MRWDELFDDLQAQAGALSAAELEAEVNERARIEAGRLTVSDRLGPAVHAQVRLSCRGDVSVGGSLSQVGPDWLLVDEGTGRQALVHLSAVLTVTGVGRLSRTASASEEVGRRLGLRSALRAIARDRSGVRMHLCDGAIVEGTIDRVGADFCEVALHAAGEFRRREEVREVAIVVLAAVSVVRRLDA